MIKHAGGINKMSFFSFQCVKATLYAYKLAKKPHVIFDAHWLEWSNQQIIDWLFSEG